MNKKVLNPEAPAPVPEREEYPKAYRPESGNLPVILGKFLRIISSYGLVVVTLLFLLLLTFLGTIEQMHQGLFAVQQKYFESIFLIHHLRIESIGLSLPLPLPGAYLLMLVLFVNLVVGGILRLRRSWSRLGLFLSHIGIAFLLLSSYITFLMSDHGHMTLYPRRPGLRESEWSSNESVSYTKWEIAIYKVAPMGGKTTEFLIPEEDFLEFEKGRKITFRGEGLPLSITMTDFMKNCRPMPGGARQEGESVVDGFFLASRAMDREAERNVAGAYVYVQPAGGQGTDGLLWGDSVFPLVVRADGGDWAIDLRRKRTTLPFRIILEKFTKKEHPRTNMPSVFMSDVTKVEDGLPDQRIKISMNEPLRHKGYTLFQASWGPANAPPGAPLYSSFAVVSNPADQFPLYSLVLITAGLLYHFSLRIARYLRAEAKRRA